MPVKLLADLMARGTKTGDIVLDLVAGLGGTIIAAEQLGRRARLRETNPRLVDLIIRRWQAFAQTDAIHAKSGFTFNQSATANAADPQEEP
jgi:DNA modification methylase